MVKERREGGDEETAVSIELSALEDYRRKHLVGED
jgi:hypothetical protein